MLTAHLLLATYGRAARTIFLEQRKEQPDISAADARKQSGVLLPNRLGSLGGCGAKDALAQAEREGLQLKRSGNESGFEGVCVNTHRTSSVKTYGPRIWITATKKLDTLGSFTTAEEAALVRAREVAARTRAKVF